MDHSINLTHDGTLILRIPKGYEVDKVVVEEMGTENRKEYQPTHPTHSNTLGALDCVDRQEAIKAILGEPPEVNYPIYYAEKIRELPSVQPERTCVNCGRTANNGGWYADGGTRCPIEEHYALPKDGYCHLWEKRNVTDDDYPEGRADE